MYALMCVAVLSLLSGCSRTGMEDINEKDKIKIVCTIFPQYDWVRQIMGSKADNAELTLLLNNGSDMHSYQPSVEDIVKISTCDLFIYVGGESDKWLDSALKDTADMIVINLMDVLGGSAKEEEIIEGMQREFNDNEAYEYGQSEYDEHVWLSLNNAEIFCSVIADALSKVDAGNAEEYKANLYSYTDKLKALDTEYKETIDAGLVDTLLFGDRFPFRYLLDDYGLNYHAAFPGCSAETEASFKTIVFLSEKTDELGLNAIMVTESSDQSIAKIIKSSTKDKNQQILVLDALQSITTKDIQNGVTYLSVMESNLNVIKDALK